ncbi:exodeoxyribonuclease VII small subunit [Helicobacter fennelliae]|uniref:Exodeoxyribonuclease VII small subunit n=1 Tax=Helicobacter fennelliae TaxID=215 RepID=A0A2X3DH71_9HELI|nr:exodeoxyribonuclease VII small subunit [Helicobacter fennelliae]SQB98749.1 exodeoxyribonuclease VII small subunit [Helicobacter fennelliae]
MQDFESKIEKAKQILTQLNAQDLSLKSGLELYKQGIKELKEAQDMLEKAKLEYEEIKAQDIQDNK